MIEMKTEFQIVLVLCSIQYLLSSEGVSYKVNRSACNQFNTKFIYNTSCRVRHVNRTTQLTNLEILIQPNVSLTNLRGQFTTFIKYTTVYRPSLIKVSENICDALNGSFSHVIRLFGASFEKFSNLLEPCPKSGKMYIKDMFVDKKNFPQFLPIGDYRLDSKYFTTINEKEEFVILIQDYIEIRPLGALQF